MVIRTHTYAQYPWTRNVCVVRQLNVDNMSINPITTERLLNVDSPIGVVAGIVTKLSTYNASLGEDAFRLNIAVLLIPSNGYAIIK